MLERHFYPRIMSTPKDGRLGNPSFRLRRGGPFGNMFSARAVNAVSESTVALSPE